MIDFAILFLFLICLSLFGLYAVKHSVANTKSMLLVFLLVIYSYAIAYFAIDGAPSERSVSIWKLSNTAETVYVFEHSGEEYAVIETPLGVRVVRR